MVKIVMNDRLISEDVNHLMEGEKDDDADPLHQILSCLSSNLISTLRSLLVLWSPVDLSVTFFSPDT